MFSLQKVKIIMLISLLSLSGCMSTDNKNQPMLPQKSEQKNQYMLSQVMDMNKKGEYEKSFELLQTLSRTGMPEAQSLLAKSYHLGLGTKINPQKAEYWYKLAASQNYPISLYLLANLYKEYDDPEGYNLYMERAVLSDLNIATEMFVLQLYIDKDKDRLLEWYEKTKGLKNHYIFENYLLEYLIEENKTEFNDKELLIWMKSLADGNNALAQYKYGIAYLKSSYGIKGNLKTAQYWLKKSALNGNMSAQRDLGMIYFKEDKYLDSYIWLLLYSQVETLESTKLRTLALSKLTQAEIVKANNKLNQMVQDRLDNLVEK